MPSNARSYAAQLRRLAREYPARVYMPRFRKIAFKVLELAVQNTPVNEGRLRNGWHVTEGAPARTEVEAGKGARGVLTAGQKVINSVGFGSGIWIQNNVPYAPIYEYGLFVPKDPGPSKATHVPKSRRDRVRGTILIQGGYSVSAPEGMLGDAVQQVEAAVGAGQL